VLGRLRNLFDLTARPDAIDAHLGCDTLLGPLVAGCPGLRVPGAFCGLELAWRAVLGQQVSVRGATTIAGRVAQCIGDSIATPIAGLTLLTPTAHRLANAGPADWTRIGVIRARSAAIRELASAVASGQIRLDPAPTPTATLASLQEIRGIGAWTAEYVAMRALRWPDAFPETDLVIRRALGAGSGREISRSTETWRPWRAYAAMHLWNAANPPQKGKKNGNAFVSNAR
jgi:AraC family transcriptional regulator of adaptative response / DNA-3-methyladenine glycosylase II